jgi:sulfite reductase alpha subunit-like flavoprotein
MRNFNFWFSSKLFRMFFVQLLLLNIQSEQLSPSPAQSLNCKRMLILFGTQTGTAEELSWRLAFEACARGFSPSCMPMDAYDLSKLPNERLLVCVVSTTGDGDPPATMARAWSTLRRRNLPCNALRGLRFAIFGCGDSSYPKFNLVARRLDLRFCRTYSSSANTPGLLMRR